MSKVKNEVKEVVENVAVEPTKVKGITAKMEMAVKAVKELDGKAYASQVLEYLDANYADRTELKTFNAVNATLAACAGKGMVNKAKGLFNDKLLTQYSIPATDAE